MNRDFVLKNFRNKLTEAKKENVREIRLSLKEMDELGFVIYELLGEYFNKTIDNVKNNDNDNDNDEVILDGGNLNKE